MDIAASIDLEELASACMNRSGSTLFSLHGEQQEQFTAVCRGSTVLITGAAGFIAQATLPHILAAKPKRLYMVDASENGLAALARKLAASRQPDHPTELRMVLADITSPLFDRAVREMGRLDVVMHFAAVKHVRTERDPVSALRILDVNLAGTNRLLTALANSARPPRLFAVSTDKAVRPTSIMGASKRLMESLIWAYPGPSTSTRFANVLFSSGSITESWIDRLGRGEPLSAPLDTYRFFVTPREAGALCANAVVAESRSIVIPDTDAVYPIDLIDLARGFLAFFDRTAVPISLHDWEIDPQIADPARYSRREYPIVFTPRDTTGEKQEEEFFQPGEKVSEWTDELSLIRENTPLDVRPLLAELAAWTENASLDATVAQVRSGIRDVIPGFHGTNSELSLDTRI